MAAKTGTPLLHSIGVVSRRTGLKPDVIRAWERRYHALEPVRTETNRRRYTDEHLERLHLLRKATMSGRQIGQVADLSTQELRKLVQEDREEISQVRQPSVPAENQPPTGLVSACLSAVENLNIYDLQLQLERCAAELPHQRVIDEVIVPLLTEIGTMWEQGKMRIVHEHLASATIRSFLAQLQTAYVPAENAPQVVVATPKRQHHEMGALIASAAASAEGWRVLYLGTDLPATEIAAACAQKDVRVVALSMVYPEDDPFLDKELAYLRRLVGPDVLIVSGGRASAAYQRSVEKIGGQTLAGIEDFRSVLRTARSRH